MKPLRYARRGLECNYPDSPQGSFWLTDARVSVEVPVDDRTEHPTGLGLAVVDDSDSRKPRAGDHRGGGRDVLRRSSPRAALEKDLSARDRQVRPAPCRP